MKEIAPLMLLVAPAALSRKAGSNTFERGEAYFKQGAVRQSIVTADSIEAVVQGTDSYRVVLHAREGDLRARCSCPHAQDGYFCKHCVAVGLAWALRLASRPSGEAQTDPWTAIEAYLLKQKVATLAELLLDAARREPRLYRLLAQQAERGEGGADEVAGIRQAIDKATDFGAYVSSDEMDDLMDELDDIVGSMKALLAPETSASLMALLEYGIERVESILEDVDEEEGNVARIVEDMGELHVQACRMGATDPAALAERLFHLQTSCRSELCSFDPQTYREALGTTGREHYRALATARWNTYATITDADAVVEEDRWAITDLMRQFARDDGHIEKCIEIESKDVSSPANYLRIAELWKEAGNLPVAVAWAERGIAAFPVPPMLQLSEFLIDHYPDCGRAQDALNMMWAQFEERPWLDSYKKLAVSAAKAGQWDAVRERALALVDANSGGRRIGAAATVNPALSPHYSLRVSIALWEDDLDSAWRYARGGACTAQVLRELADQSVDSRPDDAIGVYREMVPGVLERTSNSGYAEAMELVGKIGRALDKQGRAAERLAYLNQLRAQFKRKRNFITLLDRYIGA